MSVLPSSEVANYRGCNVLVVDDEVDLLSILTTTLAKLGCSVQAASDGRSALAMIEAGPVDAVISDLMMPEMDGLSLLSELRLRGHIMPFIVLTGQGQAGSTVSALKLGAFDYLEKPFERKTVLRVTSEALEVALALRGTEHRTTEASNLASYSSTLSRFCGPLLASPGHEVEEIDRFADTASAQCQFAIAAIKDLGRFESDAFVAQQSAFVVRVAQGLSKQARALGFLAMADLSDALIDLLAEGRLDGPTITNERLRQAQAMVTWLAEAASHVATTRDLDRRAAGLLRAAKGSGVRDAS